MSSSTSSASQVLTCSGLQNSDYDLEELKHDALTVVLPEPTKIGV